MRFDLHQALYRSPLLLLTCLFAVSGFGQQVIQRGPLGKPVQVLDETQQWTSPLLLASDHDVDIYMPDVSNPEWLKRNYTDYENKGQYTLSMFTFYRTPKACRANQIAWGFSDAAHLDACIGIGYRVRQVSIDTNLKLVTLVMAAMIGQDRQLDPASIQQQPVTRRWAELDGNTQKALEESLAIIAKQMAIYDRRMQSLR